VKHIFLFATALFVINTCFSQDVVEHKKNLTSFITEKYHTVIETNKEIRQGLYQAVHNKTAIASGMYTDNKKSGIWHFFSKNGQLIENFNYDTNTLLYEAPEDSTTNFGYLFDEKLKATDLATKPIKIGGRYYAYVPYLKLFKLPAEISGDGQHDGYIAILELLISPGGRLADYKIHLRFGNDDHVMHMNTDLLKDEDKIFIPATLNDEPATCRIFIQCYINSYDEIDMQ
jgi:hypothetical protein